MFPAVAQAEEAPIDLSVRSPYVVERGGVAWLRPPERDSRSPRDCSNRPEAKASAASARRRPTVSCLVRSAWTSRRRSLKLAGARVVGIESEDRLELVESALDITVGEQLFRTGATRR